MSFQCLKKWLNQMCVPLPATDRMRMDGLTNLDLAGRPHHAVGRMEFKAVRVPFEPHKVDESAGLTVDVADKVLI